jgi:hypothetical protein
MEKLFRRADSSDHEFGLTITCALLRNAGFL